MKQAIKAIIIAVTLTLASIALLGWQYNRLENEPLPSWEEKIEENSAKNVLKIFLITQSEKLLTERAMQQKDLKEFELAENITDYEILKTEKLSEGKYRFMVKIGDLIYVLKLIKVLDNYYIDRVEIAG